VRSTAREKSHAAFERRCIPAEPGRYAALIVAFRSEYTRYSSLTRLVSRAPRRSRCSRHFLHRPLTAVLFIGLLAASCTPAPSPAPDAPAGFGYGVPGALERARIKTAIVEEKLRTALLPAMRTHGIDMWIVLDRENHPDPLHEEIGGGFAGVRSAYIFFDAGGTEPEKIYLGSHVQSKDTVIEQIYDEKVYYGYSAEGITPHLREAVHRRDPQRRLQNAFAVDLETIVAAQQREDGGRGRARVAVEAQHAAGNLAGLARPLFQQRPGIAQQGAAARGEAVGHGHHTSSPRRA